ncbi:uncharacterized protein DNG_09889 [Cephalotrichum gorgonifer]|uniref:Arrestin-like N-terminal domain-containing protein n=1 Tax=Cephalotrichum gorgonifer TaxID=2041049 RepID=A0AAE8N912_9PEZI|nr:uncharacterized protein DNG_09889 [Cephalotrichum gorgonifer]
MYPKQSSATKGLAISIDNPHLSYKPGDTITGRVYRQVPVLVGAQDVTVTLQLIGRAKAEIDEWSDHYGESSRKYLSSVEMFPPSNTKQTLHQGPLDIPRTVPGLAYDKLESQEYDESTCRSWPFAMVIPTHASSISGPGKVVQSRTGCQRLGFVVADKDGNVAERPLPPSTYKRKREYGSGEYISGCIEYFLQAHLVSVGSNSKPEAVAPITVTSDPAQSKSEAVTPITFISDPAQREPEAVAPITVINDAAQVLPPRTGLRSFVKRWV